MSVINPNETAATWKAHRRDSAVQLYLSGAQGDAAALVNARVAGFPLNLSLGDLSEPVDPEDLAGAAAAVIQVDPNVPASVRRFEQVAAATRTPVIAAAYDPPLALIRSLVRAGAHDVVPLPLELSDLEASLAPIGDEIERRSHDQATANGRIVSIIKGVGGIGATALVSQLAIRSAEREAAFGREVCLLDLDIQFGDAAFQLGLSPSLSVMDIADAGTRLDGELLRATTTLHPSGLRVVAAPPSLVPLDSISSEQLIQIIDVAKREFGTIFVDLPANWTNWSLSLLAQSDVVLLVTEMSVAALNRARRQLELIRDQELGAVDIRIVVNRFEKGLLKTVRPGDVREALGRDIAYTIANEPQVMRPATERGVPISDIKRKSTVGKDIDLLESGIAGILGRER